MLKEICIMPEVFDKNNMNTSNWKDIKQVLNLLKIVAIFWDSIIKTGSG